MFRYLRYLRILWTVFCGVACVLLIVLWVRSYWWEDEIWLPFPGLAHVRCDSGPSRLYIDKDYYSISKYWYSFRYKGDGSGAVTLANRISQKYESKFGFGIWQKPGRTTYIVPHWFPVLLFATFAAAPWYSRIPHRFSLRTLLIATTLVAMVLGLIVWLVR